MTYDALLARLRPAAQEHLVQFWADLNPEEQRSLAAQIEGLDLDWLAKRLADVAPAHADSPARQAARA
ncbi:MAG: hypothetical protein K2X97_00165, partial [Mycobacteriaceae bacterium]|nr:hypothetical protein [Mycobacteriaceae bacterium]